KYGSRTGVVGVNHSYNYTSNTFGRTFAAISFAGNTGSEFIVNEDEPVRQSVKMDTREVRTTLGYQIEHRISSRNQVSGGVTGDLMKFSLNQEYIKDGDTEMSTDLDTEKSTGLVRGWLNWQHRFSDRLTSN